MKKYITVIAILVLVALLCAAFVACKEKDSYTSSRSQGKTATSSAEAAKSRMEDAGYEVELETLSADEAERVGYTGMRSVLTAYKSGSDAMEAIYFDTEENAYAAYERAKDSVYTGLTIGYSGKCVYIGYQDALDVFLKKTTSGVGRRSSFSDEPSSFGFRK